MTMKSIEEKVSAVIALSKKASERIFFDVEPVDWTEEAFAVGSGGDKLDKAAHNLNKKNFWDPDKHQVSRDTDNWVRQTPAMRTAVTRAFGGLTFLDTVQGLVGVPNIKPFAVTVHEPHVLSGFEFFEIIHAQSYSRINQALLSPKEIREAREWTKTHPTLSKKLAIFERVYRSGDPALVRIASVFFESFMFWTSFFLPLYLDRFPNQRLQVTATIIKLIMRDEGIHGYYIGYKFQRQLEKFVELAKGTENEFTLDEVKEYYRLKAVDLFWEIYEVEYDYTVDLYSDVGLVDKVNQFLCYNANKAFMNLGYTTPIFGPEQAKVDSLIFALMTSMGTTDDIFSGELSSYKILPYGDRKDSQWELVRDVFEKRRRDQQKINHRTMTQP